MTLTTEPPLPAGASLGAACSEPRLRVLWAGAGRTRLRSVAVAAAELGWSSTWAASDAETLALLAERSADVLILALDDAPERAARWWCEQMQQLAIRPATVIVAPRSSIQLAIVAERLGAIRVFTHPVQAQDVVAVVRKAMQRPAGLALPLPEVVAEPVGMEYLVGQSAKMTRVRRMIARLAPCNTTVLMVGDSGTGKELVARALHEFGPRARAPFVAINCAAMPETLLESELFGHEKGAFTGAVARRLGHFERAHGGTLFLDEIADMSPALQAKILRVLQDRRVERLGGGVTVPVDVRLVAATNRDLRSAVERGTFREDLYYRLAVVTLRLPTLAERGDDVVLLASHFVRRFAAIHGKDIRFICDRALALLRSRAWPGNVRELRNTIERAVLLAQGDVLRFDDLAVEEWTTGAEPPPAVDEAVREPLTLQELEAQHIARVLRELNGSVSEAAQVLGIHRNSLTRKIRRYGLKSMDVPDNGACDNGVAAIGGNGGGALRLERAR